MSLDASHPDTNSSAATMVREVVEISLRDYENRKDEIAQQLYHAAHNVGFFYIADHGISQEEVEAAFATGRTFLDLPKAEKEKYPFNPDTYLGWRGPDELETVTGNRLWEWFSVGRWGTLGYDVKDQKFLGEKWPEKLGPEFAKTSLEFQAKVHDVAIKILQSLFRGLGWDESRIDDPFELDHEENPSFLAWNYYPGLTEQEIADLRSENGKVPPRLHAHADMDVLTILFQRDGAVGLEIAPGNEVEDLALIEDVGNIWNHVPVAREWTPLDPRPGRLTVNIGDGLTRWTDGIYKSTYHRVRAPKEGDNTGPRYSMPYFVNPKLNYVIQGPEKRWGPVTGFDLLSKTGNAYAARKNNPDKSWQRAAYTDEIAHLTTEPVVAGGNTA